MTKSSMVGTYLAEQVSNSKFELLSVQHVDQLRRPATQGARGPGPHSQGGGIRRRLVPEQWQATAACTMLPSLATYSGLMQEKAGNGEGEGSLKAEERDVQDGKWERIKTSSSRLFRGERCAFRRGIAGTPSDEDVMKGLTQPLSFFGLLPNAPVSKSGAMTASGRLETTGREMSAKPRPRRHKNYKEAFHAGFAGTELASLPLRLKTPPVQPTRLKASPLRGLNESVRLGNILDLKVVPLDPVQAFFQMEEEQKANSAKAQAELEAAAEAANQQPTLSHRQELSQKFQRAVSKARPEESGILPPAGRLSTTVAPSAAVLSAESGGALQLPSGAKPAAEGEPQAVPQARDLWLDIVDALMPKQKLGPLRREASQLLRLFAFGSVGNEKKKGPQKDLTFQEQCGTKELVRMLYNLWEKIDVDGSGSVDVQEFRAFVERSVSEARAGEFRGLVAGVSIDIHRQMLSANTGPLGALHERGGPEDSAKLLQKMCDRVAAVLLAKDRKSFVIEDMMRIIWPFSNLESLRQMKAWCEEFAMSGSRWRAETPCLLDPKELEALRAVFNHFDKEGSGRVTAQELIDAGLLEKEVVTKFLNENDQNGDGVIHSTEFCELMCPTGLRAHSRAETATMPDGTRIILDQNIGGWRREDAHFGAPSPTSPTSSAAIEC